MSDQKSDPVSDSAIEAAVLAWTNEVREDNGLAPRDALSGDVTDRQRKIVTAALVAALPYLRDTPISIERYVPNGAPLTEYEREVLQILQEECAEVIQAASKLVRFGRENRPPRRDVPNSLTLSIEVGEVLCLVQMAIDAGLISPMSIDEGKWRKRDRLKYYMQTERGDGPKG